MNRSHAWMSVTSVGALVLALSGGSCSGGGAAGAVGDDGGMTADGTAGGSSGGGACSSDADCTAKLPPTTPANCAIGKCDTLAGTCTFAAKDQDGDGDPAAGCQADNGVPIKKGGDCDDHDPAISSGHSEACSEVPDGGTATSPCKQGQKSCLPDGTESACIGTVVCVNQACVNEQCAGSCSVGDTQCSGAGGAPSTPPNSVWSCTSNGTWQQSEDCSTSHQTCVASGDGGVLSATCGGKCAPGDEQCSGAGGAPATPANATWTCTSQGQWQEAQLCTTTSSTCVAAAGDGGTAAASCEGSCAPGQTQCSGSLGTPGTPANAVWSCTSKGSWGNASVCSTTCKNNNSASVVSASCQGSCGPGQTACTNACTPGSSGCGNGTTPWSCSSGSWVAGSVAPGICGAQCTPNQTTCTSGCTPGSGCGGGTTAWSCSSTGMWVDNGVTNGTCGATCSPGVCTGTAMCGSNGLPESVVAGTCNAQCTPSTGGGDFSSYCQSNPANPGPGCYAKAPSCDGTGHWTGSCPYFCPTPFAYGPSTLTCSNACSGASCNTNPPGGPNGNDAPPSGPCPPGSKPTTQCQWQCVSGCCATGSTGTSPSSSSAQGASCTAGSASWYTGYSTPTPGGSCGLHIGTSACGGVTMTISIMCTGSAN